MVSITFQGRFYFQGLFKNVDHLAISTDLTHIFHGHRVLFFHGVMKSICFQELFQVGSNPVTWHNITYLYSSAGFSISLMVLDFQASSSSNSIEASKAARACSGWI